MTPSDDPTPPLPLWIFLTLDAVLIGAAGIIANGSPRPLPPSAVFWIAALVIVGALVLCVPLVARYEGQKNAALDQRQRELENLARTIHASAEQMSIAANGLHEISELTPKLVRQAEHLPHKLQEKITEFSSLLAVGDDAAREELEKELVALRTTESERLEGISTRIAKATSDFARLEQSTQQHLAAATEAIARLSTTTAGAITQAKLAAEKALGDATNQATRSIEAAGAAALADVETRLIALVDRIARDAAAPTPAAVATEPIEPALPNAEPIAHPPKRPRQPRREEADAISTLTVTAAPVESAAASVVSEPAPMPVAKIVEIAPVAPSTQEPFAKPPKEDGPVSVAVASVNSVDAALASPAATSMNGAAVTAAEPPSTEVAPAAIAEVTKLSRKRAGRRLETVAAETERPELELGVIDAPAPADGGERTLTSDGATRLVVTAYIGIGNRLFIRGNGGGLTWEKGVPLQFVSIGKWRWETNDATTGVEFKLYKNDDVECTALGTQTVDAGYQQEVTASF